MHEAIELVHAIAWPLTTIIIFLILRVELRRFAKNMADRIQSASSITIGPRGFELRGMIKAVPLPDDVQKRKVALTRFVRSLRDRTTLDNMADALNVPRSTDLIQQKSDLIVVLSSRVESKSDMDQVSGVLKPIIGRDF